MWQMDGEKKTRGTRGGVYDLKGVSAGQENEKVLNKQKSAAVIVNEKKRSKSIGVFGTNEKGGTNFRKNSSSIEVFL